MVSNREIKRVYTWFLPPGSGQLPKADITVVADILRATTVMTRALDSGVTAIYPALEVDQAQSLAKKLPNALLCGERQGLAIPGFELGNSPGDYTLNRCLNRPMVMTTTNGTRALMACFGCREVLVLSFGNIHAIFQSLHRQTGHLHLVCSGTDGQISWEDTLACGMLARELISVGWSAGNDSTLLSIAAFNHELGMLKITDHGFNPTLFEVLKKGRGGKRVCEIGLEKDIVEVARLNDFDILGRIESNPWRVLPCKCLGNPQS